MTEEESESEVEESEEEEEDGGNHFDERDLLVDDLLGMLEKGSQNDVKIRLSDGEITANKDILVARSEYFATMFSNNNFIEGTTNCVDMSHFSKVLMEKIVKYLFSGGAKFSDLSLPQLVELAHMSKMMLLENLHDHVDGHIKLDIIPDSGDDIDQLPELISGLQLASQYNLTDSGSGLGIVEAFIKELQYGLKLIPIITNDDAKDSQSFSNLPFNLMKEIIMFDASRIRLRNRPTTIQRFNAFMVWHARNDITLYDGEGKEIVDSFDFRDFTAEELLTSVRDSGLYPTQKIDERLLELLKETIEDVKRFIPKPNLSRIQSIIEYLVKKD